MSASSSLVPCIFGPFGEIEDCIGATGSLPFSPFLIHVFGGSCVVKGLRVRAGLPRIENGA